ncbi:TRAP transporter large permease [Bosea sp. (in: a-proteobacteria)]|jgi:tripartite ATP-independent transporter DctM subunit|uniref:TRAP transporter large permease n=1 Tax=Bosea sp. (in: a-proteobacteria) TaxID=1871050 RepID=UPI001AC9EE91|nr:TRAP transporter large permease [Bosea sp. (in: a-proteobacteria)]MBN9437750.1 TRAP transporter large permease [Bosea sp. (in: a-proteobacteria)]MBN9449320.1 TRAP transporter large permease [Bosea sp. (in: a-proteobacteria)]
MLITAILLGVCFVILIGLPIAVALGLVAIVTMVATAGPDLLVIFIQRTYAGTTSFPLLAIPFFVLAGNLMNVGGTTERIFGVAQLCVGRIRGGLAHVNVVGSVIFAGMSGSAVADAAGMGVIEHRAMTKAGYSGRFAATITAVSSTIGPIIPPSIPFVIYGSLANVSVGALFLAGIVPGLLMAVALMALIAVSAKHMNLPRGDALPPLPVAVRTVAKAGPALLLPPVILLVIFTGIATPTEAAVVAAAYAFVLGRFVYRELDWAATLDVLWDTARQTAQVMFIIALAAPFGWVLIQQQIPNAILSAFLGLSSEPWVILLIINIVLLILGMFIEGIAIMIIAYPVLLPIIAKIGVDPVHFGVILVLNIMIGLVTPPVGLCLYVVAGIAKISIAEITREIWPYVLALIAVLMLITYVPAISLWLPHALGYGVAR